ncbi:hypothetical protein JCGZ_19314 [Jatropha curcas]|uniref:Uncharacterized protein n=1 Tax=Jatropha curcas TaxID=180498 RepID=A0A067K0T1_JATCU|nr:hypothetical protein JCGZ_19314 [Jatropha curcas]
MARGRAIVLDTSSSGPRGGHGRGCSTRGRGGTIPPPSSGTSGASSSTPAPMLPRPPSIPSSSTPLFGLAESSLASKSPTTLASSEPCNKLNLVAGHIYLSSRASRQIVRIIKLHLNKDGYTWDAVPQAARDFYWEEFQAERYRREPTSMEVFSYTHTKDHDGNSFVDRRALDINRQLTELRAHVMQMSGQHGAATSSSDPLPALDRDVSTALHQPLSPPLDLDTVDDTLVTPTNTMTHPVDIPADATTLDHVEDQPCRFDFGPF